MTNSAEKAQPIIIENREVYPPKGRLWQSSIDGMHKLLNKGRLLLVGNSLRYIRYFDDFPVFPLDSLWTDTGTSGFGDPKRYVVQTLPKVIARCILMTTDPGDLVIDPTCGSGTSAYVAEQFGRRWITIDTSRIALNIAKQRLMTSVFPYYKLYDEISYDIRQGFIYKTVPHITLKSLANDEPPTTETLYYRPEVDNKKLRVSGPFTVETLQNFESTAPEELEEEVKSTQDATVFEETVKQHLVSAGIKNGRKDEQVVFSRVELLNHPYLHAEGFYMNGTGEKKAYIHIGPKFGTVSKNAVNEGEVIKAFRDTWTDGVHSYLTYLRDRLLIAKELLTDSGSCFVQISDENVHLVRSVMDEVFGSENFCSLITFTKSTGLKSKGLPARCDFILWYCKNIGIVKYRQLFEEKVLGELSAIS